MKKLVLVRQSDNFREDMQKQGSLLCLDGNVLLCYPTGFGKTKTVCDALPLLLQSNLPIYFVTSRLVLIENTKKDFEKYGLDHYKIEFLCYQSLKNIKKKGIFILDEVHNITDNYAAYIKKLATSVIALTATMPKEKEYLLKEIGVTRKQEITLDIAIKEGVLPMPELVWHSVPLDGTEKKYVLTKYTGKGKPKKATPRVTLPYSKYWTSEFPDTVLQFNLTAKEYYAHLDKEVAYYQRQANNPRKPYAKAQFQQKALNRKKWLSEYKLSYMLEKVKENPTTKKLLYLNNIEQCERLGFPSYHSKNDKAANEQNLDSFILGLISILTSVNSLKEGQNIAGIEEAYILQLDNVKDKPNNFIQMVGRTLRGQTPKVHVFYVPETQDEKYFLKTFKKWM